MTGNLKRVGGRGCLATASFSKRSYVVLGLILLLSTVLAGCSRRTAAPIAVPVHDTVILNTVQHDSIYVDHFREVTKMGDTVFDTRTEYVYRERQVHDTTVQVVNVPYAVTKTEYVEKVLSPGQRFLIRAGWVTVAIVLLGLVYLAYRVWRGKSR